MLFDPTKKAVDNLVHKDNHCFLKGEVLILRNIQKYVLISLEHKI